MAALVAGSHGPSVVESRKPWITAYMLGSTQFSCSYIIRNLWTTNWCHEQQGRASINVFKITPSPWICPEATSVYTSSLTLPAWVVLGGIKLAIKTSHPI